MAALGLGALAKEPGRNCVPHVSGRGLGTVYVTHFASIFPNTTDYQEYKGDPDPVPCEVTGKGERFVAVDGRLSVPSAPGMGIPRDPDYLVSLAAVPS